MTLENHLSDNVSSERNLQTVTWGGKKLNTASPTSRQMRRMRNKFNRKQISPMVSIKHDYVENNTNKRIGDFRFLDGQDGRVSPELIKFFNGSER